MGEVAKRKRGRPVSVHRRVPETHKQKFIELIAGGGRVHRSAYLAGHDPRTFWRIMEADPPFKAEFERAKEIGAYVMVDEAERRGVEGWDEPVFGKGPDGYVEEIGSVHKFDSNLLMFTIKGRLPQYKDNPKIDLSQTTVSLKFEDRSAAIEDVWRVLRDAGVKQAVVGGEPHRELLPGPAVVVAEPSEL